jgi:hypothetical protein
MQPVELGALLWTLTLREGDWAGYHRIGYGKPLGFGSVQIAVDSVEVIDMAQRGRGTGDFAAVAEDQPARWIQAFRDAMQQLYGDAFASLPNIADIMALLGERDDDLPVHYPRPNPNRAADDNEGFKWFMGNRDGRKERLKPATEDDGLPYKTK